MKNKKKTTKINKKDEEEDYLHIINCIYIYKTVNLHTFKLIQIKKGCE